MALKTIRPLREGPYLDFFGTVKLILYSKENLYAFEALLLFLSFKRSAGLCRSLLVRVGSSFGEMILTIIVFIALETFKALHVE